MARVPSPLRPDQPDHEAAPPPDWYRSAAISASECIVGWGLPGRLMSPRLVWVQFGLQTHAELVVTGGMLSLRKKGCWRHSGLLLLGTAKQLFGACAYSVAASAVKLSDAPPGPT